MNFCLLLVIRILLITGLLATAVTSAAEKEVNITSVVGDNVTLPCQSLLNSDVDWRHQDTPTSSVYYVYTNGLIYDIFRSRFAVHKTPDLGEYDLVISRVQLSDAGLYICIGERGLGRKHVVYQLTVIPETAAQTTSLSPEVDGDDDNNTPVAVVVVVVVLLVLLATVATFVVLFVVFRQRRQQKHLREQQVLLPDVEQHTRDHASKADMLLDITARIKDLEDKISRKRERESQLNQDLEKSRDVSCSLEAKIQHSKQSQEDFFQQINKQSQGRDELIVKLDKVKLKEKGFQEQTQKKSDKLRQVKSELEQLKEATSGLETHLKKQVNRLEEIDQELKDLSAAVDDESGKRKSKEVLGRLKELAERENTLQVELKEVRYLKVEIPRQLKENSQRETELKEKLVRVEEKESNLSELLKAKSSKRKLIEAEISADSQTESRLKGELELEKETENKLQTQLEQLRTDREQKEQELNNVREDLEELLSELDKAKVEESRTRDLLEKERETAESLEAEQHGEVGSRDETLLSFVDEQRPSSRGIVRDSSQPVM